MTTRPAIASRRLLPLLMALLGMAGWTTSASAAASSPLTPSSATAETIVGPAIPWQFAPAVVAPALMPEAYYVTTGTTTGTAGTGSPGGGGGSNPPGNGGNNPPGGGITIQGGGGGNPPNTSPEPASLITSAIGIGFVAFRLWRRRMQKRELEADADSGVSSPVLAS